MKMGFVLQKWENIVPTFWTTKPEVIAMYVLITVWRSYGAVEAIYSLQKN